MGLRDGTPVCGGLAAQALLLTAAPDCGGLAQGLAGGEVGFSGKWLGAMLVVLVLVWKEVKVLSGVIAREAGAAEVGWLEDQRDVAEIGEPGCAPKGLLTVVVVVVVVEGLPRTRFSKSDIEVAMLGVRGSPIGPEDIRSVVGERKPFA